MPTTTPVHTLHELNDRFRHDIIGHGSSVPPIPGRLVITRGIAALPLGDQLHILHQVQTFSDFTEANDPHGEHACASFPFRHHTMMWKIEYYNDDLTADSEDPLNLEQTHRVLTIMFSHEY